MKRAQAGAEGTPSSCVAHLSSHCQDPPPRLPPAGKSHQPTQRSGEERANPSLWLHLGRWDHTWDGNRSGELFPECFQNGHTG